tara:strand:- start:776 stop:1447 length:672 start_codon:yes stop_codon:yes gene_type:complete
MKRYEVGKVIAYKDDQVLNDKLDLMEEELDIVIEQVYEEGGYIFAEGYEDKVIEPITYKSGFFRPSEPKSGPLNQRFTDVEPEVWQAEIKEVWKHLLFKGEDDPSNQSFIDSIWNASKNILGGLEISVIIDRDGKLFMNSGSPGYVEYGGVNVAGMKIPLRCWIHTHPFGQAFWSGTDTNTLRNWRPILEQAIVIGNQEYLQWDKLEKKEVMTKVVWKDQFKL